MSSSVSFSSLGEGEDFDLSKDCVLVAVKISQVGVTANSKRMSRDAAATYEADKGSVKGYVQKILWSDLSPLTRVYNEARVLLESKTLFWSKEWRLCPVQNYTDLMKEIRSLENRFNDEVTKLVRRHSDLEASYQKRVGKLASDVKFPTAEQMQSAFAFKVEESLVPSTDIRLRHVSEEARQQISDRVRQSVKAQMGEAQKDLISRFTEAVERIVKGTREGGKLHKSAVESLQATLETVSALNITSDPKLEALINKAKKELGDYSPEDFKVDGVKEAVAASAGSILDDLRGFGGSK